jgi:hypothetical protein
MARRFKNKHLSMPYFKCLHAVNAIPIIPEPTIEEARNEMEPDVANDR